MNRYLLILTSLAFACDPNIPEETASGGGSGGQTSATSTSTSTSTTTSPTTDPTAADVTGDPDPETQYCDFHRFRFDNPPNVGLQFPDPSGPVNSDGSIVMDTSVGLWCNDAPGNGSNQVDLRGVTFNLDPAWLAIGGLYEPTPPPQSSQNVAQTWYDDYVCAPIESKPTALAWQLLSDRAQDAAHRECIQYLEDNYGCVGGAQYPGLGQGAWDVCNWYLTNPLAQRLKNSTYPVINDNTDEKLVYTDATLCDTDKLDQACGGGADSSSSG